MVVLFFSVSKESHNFMTRDFAKYLESILGPDQKKIMGINVKKCII
jgi:hypothetical protein